MKLTWYSHACFLIEVAGSRLIVDPFLTGNRLAPVRADEVNADYVLVSHGHGDHLGDAIAIAKKTGATVITNAEIAQWLAAQGVKNVHPQQIGGSFAYPWGRAKLTIAVHGSALPDGSCGGCAAGFLLYIEGKKVYHAGDTGLFYDMKLIGEEGIDLALLPIGDNYTMGPDDALRAVRLLEPGLVVPMHYDTFDVIRQDPAAWARRVESLTKARVAVLGPGGSMSL